MPQLTEFPYLPPGDPHAAVDALIAVCREIPAEGESYRSVRKRLRERDLWDKTRVRGFQRFFAVDGGPTLMRSPLLEAVASAANDAAARDLLAERMWEANPILFKIVIERLSERVSPPEELYSFLDSFAYRGRALPRQELLSWVQLARGLDLLKRVGIAFGPGERVVSYLERAKKLEIDEYLEEDAAEPQLTDAVFSASSTAQPSDLAAASAAPTPVLAAPSAPMMAMAPDVDPELRRAADALGSPLGRERAVALGNLRGSGIFDADVLEETTARLERWWTAGEVSGGGLAPADFDVDAERWMDGSEVAMYRLAVAAAFAFRLNADRAATSAAYRALESAKVLDDLYYGTAPEELPSGVDSRALMLASLVARRCAEVPDLAAELERKDSAAEAFAALEAALGRGLFEIELFWLMRALRDVGAIRFDDIDDFTALPTRTVRDTLFRLGYLESPYADGVRALCAAAASAHAAAGSSGPADVVLGAFALSAGCAYGCTKRKACEFACRERLG